MKTMYLAFCVLGMLLVGCSTTKHATPTTYNRSDITNLAIVVERSAGVQTNPGLLDTIAGVLNEEFQYKGINLLPRSKLDVLVKEFQLQSGGMTDPDTRIRAGKWANASHILHVQVTSCRRQSKDRSAEVFLTGTMYPLLTGGSALTVTAGPSLAVVLRGSDLLRVAKSAAKELAKKF